MAIQTAEVQEKARACCTNPKLLITYLWFITLVRHGEVCSHFQNGRSRRPDAGDVCVCVNAQVFGFMYALAAIVAAVNNNGSGEADSKSLGFVGVWAMFLIIGLSVGGTMVMRKYQTPLAVGFFIGVVIMMSLQMFTLSVLFAGAAYLARQERDKGNDSTSVHSNDAGAIFSFFMFVLYVRPPPLCLCVSDGRASDPHVSVCAMPVAGVLDRARQAPQRDHQGGRGAGPERARRDHDVGGEERGKRDHDRVVAQGHPHGPRSRRQVARAARERVGDCERPRDRERQSHELQPAASRF